MEGPDAVRTQPSSSACTSAAVPDQLAAADDTDQEMAEVHPMTAASSEAATGATTVLSSADAVMQEVPVSEQLISAAISAGMPESEPEDMSVLNVQSSPLPQHQLQLNMQQHMQAPAAQAAGSRQQPPINQSSAFLPGWVCMLRVF